MRRLIDTIMVQQRKLTSGINAHFPLAFLHFGVNPLLQTNALASLLSVCRHFLVCFHYQSLPNFTNLDQKCAANGLERGSKQGFWASDLFKSCQIPRYVSSSNRRHRRAGSRRFWSAKELEVSRKDAKVQRRAESRRRTSLCTLLPLRLRERLLAFPILAEPTFRSSSRRRPTRYQPYDSIIVASQVAQEKEQRSAESKALVGQGLRP